MKCKLNAKYILNILSIVRTVLKIRTRRSSSVQINLNIRQYNKMKVDRNHKACL